MQSLLRQLPMFTDPCTQGTSKHQRREHDAYFTRDLRPFLVLSRELAAAGFSVHDDVWECCAGRGDLSERIKATRRNVVSTDLIDHGYHDLAKTGCLTHFSSMPGDCRSIVTNPPFVSSDIDRLISHLLLLAQKRRGQVCLLLRHEFDTAGSAFRRSLLNNKHFLTKIILPFRPIFEPPKPKQTAIVTRSEFNDVASGLRGSLLHRLDLKKVGNPRFPYAWYVWDFRQRGGLRDIYPGACEQMDMFSTIVCAGDFFEGEVVWAKHEDRKRQALTS